MTVGDVGLFLVALGSWYILWKLIEWGMQALQSKIERTRR